MNDETLFEETLEAAKAYFAACLMIASQRKQLEAQRKYIQELEKQLEYCNPGILKEVEEFLGRDQEQEGRADYPAPVCCS